MHLLERVEAKTSQDIKRIASARTTHLLKIAEARTDQNTEIRPAGSTHNLEWLGSELLRSQKVSEKHSLPDEGRG